MFRDPSVQTVHSRPKQSAAVVPPKKKCPVAAIGEGAKSRAHAAKYFSVRLHQESCLLKFLSGDGKLIFYVLIRLVLHCVASHLPPA